MQRFEKRLKEERKSKNQIVKENKRKIKCKGILKERNNERLKIKRISEK